MSKTEEIVSRLKKYNAAYRAGSPLISDAEYDELIEELRSADPDNRFLHTVEPEVVDPERAYRHKEPMLSVEKAYSVADLKRFLARVTREAEQVGVYDPVWRVTAKLDGLAAKYDGRILSSRGNGWKGQNITDAFEKGVITEGDLEPGTGEIAIVKSYFDSHLSDHFEHPRNMAVGIINSDSLNEISRKALKDKMVRFVPYANLPSWTGGTEDLLREIENVVTDLTGKTDYYIDGMVIEVTDKAVRAHMGATAHHYRWNIALKSKGETAVSRVEDILWQVGKTGKITPVLIIQPVRLSGASIKRVSAHHAGMVKNNRIGIGSSIEIIRSGEVIPKIERIIKTEGDVEIPENCPSCSSLLEWERDFLVCRNLHCPGRVEQSIDHWFKTLGNADWFGIKTIQKIVAAGYDTLEKIYAMARDDFASIGFGDVQSDNLAGALRDSLKNGVEDWRFLGAFGIRDLGTGDSRKLLSHFRIGQITGLTADDIIKIHGFGKVTSRSVSEGIHAVRARIDHMLELGFNLETTPLEDELEAGKLSGKTFVFTGKMVHGSRDQMKKQALAAGGKVGTAVSGRTDYLVCGENVGAKKIEDARKKGVKTISESDFFDLMGRAS